MAESDLTAKAQGLQSLEQELHKSGFDPMHEAHWTAPMALAWICRPDPTWVAEFWDDESGFSCEIMEGNGIRLTYPHYSSFADVLKKFSDYQNNEQCPSALNAYKKLRECLQSGKLEAFGAENSSGEIRKIAAIEWSILESQQCTEIHKLDYAGWNYNRVRVKRDDVLRLWPAKSAEADLTVKARVYSEHLPDRQLLHLWEAISYALHGYALPPGICHSVTVDVHNDNQLKGLVQYDAFDPDDFQRRLSEAAFAGHVRFQGIHDKSAHETHEAIPQTYFARQRGFYGESSEISSRDGSDDNSWKEVLVEREGFVRWLMDVYPYRRPWDEAGYQHVMSGRTDTPTNDILWRARSGEITPAEAELEAKARGLPPLAVRPDPAAYDPRKKPWWSLAMVLAWIAWRDYDEVLMWDNEYRPQCQLWHKTETGHAICQLSPGHAEWFDCIGELSWSEAQLGPLAKAAIQSARRDLWDALSSGRIQAFGLPEGGGVRRSIEAHEWPDIKDMSFGKGRETFVRKTSNHTDAPAYSSILWRREDVVALWRVEAASNTVPQAAAAKSNDVPKKPLGEGAVTAAYRVLVPYVEAMGADFYTDQQFDLKVMKALFPGHTNHRDIVRFARAGEYGVLIPPAWRQQGKRPSHMQNPTHPDMVAAELRKKLK